MSTVRVYLKKEAVRAQLSFKSEMFKDGSGEKMTLCGISVFELSGRLYSIWRDDAPITDELKDLVEEISCYETIPQIVRRESGIYRLESAECELTQEYHCGVLRYELKTKGKGLEDVNMLRRKIKTGTIRPEESYEDCQGGKTRKKLEDEIRENQQQIDEERVIIDGLRRNAEESFYSINRLRKTISDSCMFPLIFKSTVLKKIDSMLQNEFN